MTNEVQIVATMTTIIVGLLIFTASISPRAVEGLISWQLRWLLRTRAHKAALIAYYAEFARVIAEGSRD